MHIEVFVTDILRSCGYVPHNLRHSKIVYRNQCTCVKTEAYSLMHSQAEWEDVLLLSLSMSNANYLGLP